MNSTSTRRTFAQIDRQHRDGPDMLRVGTPRAEVPLRPGTTPIGLGLTAESELYRVRTMPHLYDEGHVDLALECAQTMARVQGRLLADCHACRCTTMVTADTDRCTCGAEF